MKRIENKKFFTAALAIFIFMFTFSGCQMKSKKPVPTSKALAILVGMHQGGENINLENQLLKDKIIEAILGYGYISMIRIDGKPELVFEKSYDIPDVYKNASPEKLRMDASEKANSLLKEIYQLQAQTPEVNTLAAIQLAARTLHSRSEENKAIFILQSGISTTGDIAFQNNLLAADNGYIIRRLEERSSIPDLKDVEVIWCNLGDTSAPQPELSNRHRKKLKNLWEGILLKGGVTKVEFSPIAPKEVKNRKDLPAVTVIELSVEEPIGFDGESEITFENPVILSEENIRFLEDTDLYHDPNKTAYIIQKVADSLSKHPEKKILILGTVAGDIDNSFARNLSQARALAVKKSLVSCGISELRLEAIGMSCVNPFHVYGIPLNSPESAQNRKVVLLDSESDFAHKLIKDYSITR